MNGDFYRFLENKSEAVISVFNKRKKYASLSVDHSVHLKETYENLGLVFTKMKYEDHNS